MKRRNFLISAFAFAASANVYAAHRTSISIQSDNFFINGQPTYKGRMYKNMKIEGLLMNSRVVQGIYDDRNPNTNESMGVP